MNTDQIGWPEPLWLGMAFGFAEHLGAFVDQDHSRRMFVGSERYRKWQEAKRGDDDDEAQFQFDELNRQANELSAQPAGAR